MSIFYYQNPEILKLPYHVREIVSYQFCPFHMKNFCYYNYMDQSLMCATCLQQYCLHQTHFFNMMPQQNIEIHNEEQSKNNNKIQKMDQFENEKQQKSPIIQKQTSELDQQLLYQDITSIDKRQNDKNRSYGQKSSNETNIQFQNKKNNKFIMSHDQDISQIQIINSNLQQNVGQNELITEFRKQVQYELNQKNINKEIDKNIIDRIFDQFKLYFDGKKIFQNSQFNNLSDSTQYPFYLNQQQSLFSYDTKQLQQRINNQQQISKNSQKEQKIHSNYQIINQQKQITSEISIQPNNDSSIANKKIINYQDYQLNFGGNNLSIKEQKNQFQEQRIRINVKREEGSEQIQQSKDQKRKFVQQMETFDENQQNIKDCKYKEKLTSFYDNDNESCNFYESKKFIQSSDQKQNNNNIQILNFNNLKQEFNQKLEEQEEAFSSNFQFLNRNKIVDQQEQKNQLNNTQNNLNHNENPKIISQKIQKNILSTIPQKLEDDQLFNQQNIELIYNQDETIYEQQQKQFGEVKKETHIDSQINVFSSSTQENNNPNISIMKEQKLLIQNIKNKQNQNIQAEDTTIQNNARNIYKPQKEKHISQGVKFQKKHHNKRKKRIGKQKRISKRKKQKK